MVRSAVDPINNGIGGAFQLILQTTRHQTTQHGVSGIIAMQGKAGDIRFTAGPGHDPMYRLDNIATNRQIAQRLLEARLQGPASRRDPFGQAEALKPCSSAEQKAPQLGIPIRTART